MLRRLVLLALTSLPASPPLAAAAVHPAAVDGVEHSVGSDYFAAGRAISLTGAVDGDAFAAGERVAVDGSVAGDAFLAGAQVEVRGPVGQSLYAAGAVVVASGSVRRNARLVGGTVEVTPGAHFGGSLSMAGKTLSFAGAADGYLQMAGRDAAVNGQVSGDLEVSAERIEIGPGARIAGKLRYRSAREPVIAAGAEIGAGLERLPGPLHAWSWGDGARRALHGVGRGVWLGGSFVLGALLLLLAPGALGETSKVALSEWPLCLGIGFGVIVAVPVAAVLLIVTLIGIPLALLVLALYVAVLLLGHVVAAIAVGDYALGRWLPARAGAASWRVLGLLGALVALALVRQVPLVGGLVALLVFLAGVGALGLCGVRQRGPAPADG
jgi:cytoskeletal protein CcmA (bactofilin family)